ncbi:MAG TPA: cytochrome c [Candidatus Methylomirabilis sp.]|nr:cytochrome c [Candidatus Methylomirabilis sp.]
MRNDRTFKAILGVCLFAVSIALCIPAKADDKGAALYKQKCVACHGADGKGDTATGKAMKVKDFASDDVKKMSDADLSDAIAKGKGKMPPFKTLTADQVKDLVAYVRGLQK